MTTSKRKTEAPHRSPSRQQRHPHRPASPRLARRVRAALQRHLQKPAEVARTFGVREHGRHPGRPATGGDGAEPGRRRQ